MQINLKDYIAPCYYRVYKSVLKQEYQTYRLKGGRASLKSTFCATMSILLMLKYSWVCVIVFMKHKIRLRNGAYNLYCEVIQRLHIEHLFEFSVSPMKITYKKTGQFILFSGMDDEGYKTKGLSTGSPKLFFGVSHFEELDQFFGNREIDTALESIIRGCPFHWCFQCYNPPENRNNWVNIDSLKNVDGRLVYHTDYRMVPQQWLGKPFYDKMKQTRARSEREYRWRYLGEATGTGGSVFDNIREWKYNSDVYTIGSTCNGFDWGYYPDPAAFVRWIYDYRTDSLYMMHEHVTNKSTYSKEARYIINSNFNDVETILDSARGEEMLTAFRNEGIMARNMYKGRTGNTSRDFGIHWMQTRKNIYIDKSICPVANEEFTCYEYIKDIKTGEITNKIQIFNDHTIDATRYAVSPIYQIMGDSNYE